jgi:hypothetical protein
LIIGLIKVKIKTLPVPSLEVLLLKHATLLNLKVELLVVDLGIIVSLLNQTNDDLPSGPPSSSK